MYGMKPRWSRRECASTTAIAKPNTAPIRKPTAASFAVKSIASQQHFDQQRPVPPRRLEELADDVVHVRERPVVHLEAAEPEAGRLAEPLEAFPEGVEDGEHQRGMAETLERGTHAYSLPR